MANWPHLEAQIDEMIEKISGNAQLLGRENKELKERIKKLEHMLKVCMPGIDIEEELKSEWPEQKE